MSSTAAAGQSSLIFILFLCQKIDWAIKWAHRKVKNPDAVNGSGVKDEMNSSAGYLGSAFEAAEKVRARSGSQLKCLGRSV